VCEAMKCVFYSAPRRDQVSTVCHMSHDTVCSPPLPQLLYSVGKPPANGKALSDTVTGMILEGLAALLRKSRRCYEAYSLMECDSVVPSSPILVIMTTDGIGPSETSVFTRATRRNIPDDFSSSLP
jgi:hypothetical protein